MIFSGNRFMGGRHPMSRGSFPGQGWTDLRRMSDDDLIERARRGDEAAVRALYERHAARVYAVVRRLAGDDALAEDWAQEAWVQAIRALWSFPWRRAVLDLAAPDRGEQRAPGSALAGATGGPGGTVAGHAARRRWRFLGTDRPPPPTGGRDPTAAGTDEAGLVLHDVEGYTHEEIGRALGIASGTSKSQLFKARARMRELLAPVPAAASGER